MLQFKRAPMEQSPWIYDLYNHYFSEKTDGFFVEIGVGHVINWDKMGIKPSKMTKEIEEMIIPHDNNTIPLAENGWSGIYIEPIKEFLDNELKFLLQKLLPENHSSNIQMIPCGASDKDCVLSIVDQETLGNDDFSSSSLTEDVTMYSYQNRKVSCRRTSDILDECKCPKEIDVMSIDVESHEIRTINGIDFSKHSPKLMIIESCLPRVLTSTRQQLIEALPDNYTLLHDDGLNAAFLRSSDE